jgi:hypothetical protein
MKFAGQGGRAVGEGHEAEQSGETRDRRQVEAAGGADDDHAQAEAGNGLKIARDAHQCEERQQLLNDHE